MNVLFHLCIMICYSFYCVHSGSLPPEQEAEQLLIRTLLSTSYNKNVRPDVQVNVLITASILQIISIDEKQQIMTSSSYIGQLWEDSRLSWTPNATYNNVTVVMLPVKSIWIPDTMILNSADANPYLTISDYSYASVLNTGYVYMILPALAIKTRCNYGVRAFPFDKQTCSINFTSWSQGENRVQYVENRTLVIDVGQFVPHPLWTLNDTDMVVIRSDDRVPFEDTTNTVLSIQLFLVRKPMYFMVNGIFACLVLNCVTLLAYALPFGSQVGLCMTCFMTFSVYSLSFANMFPQQSDYLMLITLYFLLSIAWTLLSLLWFVICNYYTTKAEMPKCLAIFAGFLQKIMCCCFPSDNNDKKGDKKDEDNTKNQGNKNSNGRKVMSEPDTSQATCIPCGDGGSSCCRRQPRVEDKFRVYVPPGRLPPMQARPTDLNPTQEEPTVTSERETEGKEKEKEKEKCNFCRRCESCQTDFDKDKSKGKNKKEIEAKCNALNYFIFTFILIFVIISNIVVWVVMSL